MGGWDNERAEEKKRELINIFRDGLLSQGFNESHISEMEKKIFQWSIYFTSREARHDLTLYYPEFLFFIFKKHKARKHPN